MISVNGENPNIPALVTSTDTGPSSLRTLANACSTAGSVGDVGADTDGA